MDLLKELGLYGDGLIPISSKARIDRYNKALIEIGLDPTSLEFFHIDGWGWSPEIAKEKDDQFYLSHGLANPYAIILTPEQQQVSVIMPHHSFDKYIMRKVFAELGPQINDLTTQTAIIMECDQAISHYRKPSDLLDIEFFTLRFTTVEKLAEAKTEQIRLEKQFYDVDEAWADKSLRTALRDSYREYGILSKRKFSLPDLHFPDVKCFQTNAFGGTFVLRGIASLPKDVIAHENPNFQLEDMPAEGYKEYHLSDSDLLHHFEKHGVIGVYESKLFDEVEDLERHSTMLFISAFEEAYPEQEFDQLSSGQKKRYINEFLGNGKLPETYVEIEQLVANLKRGKAANVASFSPDLKSKLLRPNPILAFQSRVVVWRMLLQINPFDVFRLYVYHKLEFFKQYESWSPQKKKFVAHYIKDRYTRNSEFFKN